MIGKEPNNRYANFYLGLLYDESGEYGNTEDYYIRTLLVHPHDSATLYNLGVLLTRLKRSAMSSAF